MEDENSIKRAVLEAVAESWNRAGIEYTVAHGVERYPEHLGRDIDVVFTPETLEKATRLAVEVLQAGQWKVTFARREWAWWIFAFQVREKGILSVEVDLLPWLQAGFTRVVENPGRALHRRQAGPFWTDPWASVGKRLVLQTFSGNFDRYKTRPWELALSAQEMEVTRANLERLAGKACQPFMKALEASDLDGLRATAPGLKRAMLLHAMRFPIEFFSKARFTIARFFRLNIFPRKVVPIIALVGPDGVGKSTLMAALKEQMETQLVFPFVLTRHWRPQLLPDLADVVKLKFRRPQNKAPTAPRSSPGKGNIFRAVYYTLDFLIGTRWLDYRESVRLNAILYDRHAVDMLVNPHRYGLKRMPKFLYNLIPRPDLIVALVDDPERVHARKAELTLEEIRVQVAHWRELHRQGVIDVILEVNDTPEVLASRVNLAIVEKFCEDNAPERTAFLRAGSL